MKLHGRERVWAWQMYAPLWRYKVRSARGSAVVGKSEVLHSLVQTFSTGSMFSGYNPRGRV